MTKKNDLTYEERLIDALKRLPNPMHDKRHGIFVKLEDDRARSNQSRFEHILQDRHGLKPGDIERISEKINQSTLRKDPERTDTYNLYIERNRFSGEYIKISVTLDFSKSNEATIKTIFITRNLK